MVITKKNKIFFNRIVVFALFNLFVNQIISGATTYTWTGSTSTAWATTTNWSPNGNPGSASGDIVIIPSVTRQPLLTISPSYSLASLTFSGIAATLTITGVTLNVTGAVTLNNAANANTAANIAGTGTLNCGSLVLGNGTAPATNNTNRTHTFTTTLASLTISGNLTISSYFANNKRIRNGVFIQTSGTVTVNGTLTTVNANAANTSTFTLGNTNPTLILGGATPFNISGTGTNTITLNGTGATVDYAYGGAQTVRSTAYTNLTFSGSGTKTLQTGTTIGGSLTLSGSASSTFVENIAIGGNLNIGTSTSLDLATFTSNRSSVGGTLAIAGTLQLSGTSGGQTGSNFPTNFSILTMTGGTVNYNKSDGGQTIFSTPTYNNLTLSNTSGTQTASGALTINGTLTTTAGGTLNMSTNQLLGTLNSITNNGTIQTQNITSTPIPTGKTWGGTVQYNATSGGQTVMAGIYNNLTLSNTSGTQTASGALTVNGTLTTTAGGTLNMSTNQLLGTLSTITNNGIIQTQNITATPISTGKTWGGIGTVQYNATSGGQTVMAGIYNNLTLSNTSGTQTASGALTVNGTLATTAGGTLNMSTNQLLGTLSTITNNGTIQTQNTSATPIPTGKTWGGTGTVQYIATSGNQTVMAGTYNNLTLSNTSGTQTASGALTVNGALTTTAGGTLNMGTNQLLGTLSTITNNGTFQTQNTSATPIPTGKTWGGTVQYNATSGGQTVMAGTYNDLTLSNTSGTQTASGALTVNGALTTTAGGILNMGTNQLLGTLSTITNNGTIQTQNTSATPVPTGKTWGGTVIFDGASGQTIPAATFNNLTINNSSGATFASNITLNNQLTLTAGNLTLGSNNLILGAAALAVAGAPFSASKMIIDSGTGQVRKLLSSTPITYFFPIGDATGTLEYSPIEITVSSATLNPGALMAVNVIDAQHPQDHSTTNYISRYWNISQTGISNMSAAVTGTFVPADIVGSTANIISSRYINPTWVEQNAATSSTISAYNIVAFGDFTGRNNLPVLNVNPTTLTGFSYVQGLGPSSEQSFTISGSALSTNITVLPSTKFEISTGTGLSFSPMALITANVVNREVQTTTIYVRLKAGLSAGVVAAEALDVSSTGATSNSVMCSGNVINSPTITTSVSSLNGFGYLLGSNTSAVQSFTVSGANLAGDIIIAAPADYQISFSPSSNYLNSLTLTRSGGNVALDTIYVRLKTGLLVNNYIENITLTTLNGSTKTITCTGAVNSGNIFVTKFTLAGFIYTVNSGPSSVQSVDVSGTNLTANLVITPPSNFEISTDSLNNYTSSAIQLTPSGNPNNVAWTRIFVRMKAAIVEGIISPENITVTSTGIISQTIACSGQVASSATTISSNGTLNGFVYMYNQGPSIVQSFTISATSLTTNVTVTPPSSNFEISLNPTSGYVSSSMATYVLYISPSSGTVNSVPVYVRLKAGLPIGTYSGQNIVLSSTNADDVNVTCNGIVVAQPSIIAGPTGLDSLCSNANVTLTSTGTNISNQTWTGPNGFYSTQPNPALGVVTGANNGTYTVTGNTLSNVNLLTNGDFELGNVGFGSSYICQQTAPPEKGNYWISANPQDMYGGFCACPDHTPTGTKMMLVDGATTIGTVTWAQSIAVAPNTEYQFSYWIQNIYSNPNLAIMQLYVNGLPLGSPNTCPTYGSPWTQFVTNVNSGSNTVLQLTLINKSTEPNGNDFALDDFEFQQIFTVSSSVNLIVNPTLTPTVSISASSNPVYANTIVSFTATPTNGGSSPQYQWLVNGLGQGTDSPTFEYTPLPGDVVTCVMTSSYPCTTGNPATSNVITMTVNPRSNYWRGNISSDWGDATNWTGGYVPAAGDDVEFATNDNNNNVPAERDLQLDINRTIGYLINNTDLLVVIPTNLTLIVNHSVQSNNTSLKFEILASSSLPNGSLIFHNSSNQPIKARVEMWSQSTWNLNAPKKNDKYKWQFFGIPIDTAKASPTVDGAYIRFRDEAGNDTVTHWHSLTNTSNIIPFYGYELCYQTERLIAFEGKLVNRNFYSGQLAKTTTNAVLYGGQHIFANPYTAAIDIRQLEFGSDMEKTVYLYNTGTFASWDSIKSNGKIGSTPGQYTASPQLLAGTSQIPRQVPSMSSMLVRVNSSTSTPDAYININYNDVVMGNAEQQRAPSLNKSSSNLIGTRIDVESKSGIDKMWLFANDQLSKTFDNGYDAKKMTGSALNQQIYDVEEDGNYQINALDDLNNTKIAFQAGQDTDYKITFNHENLGDKYSGLFLYDMIENKVINVTEDGSTYNFTATSTPTPVIRFKIIAKSEASEALEKSNIIYFNINNTMYFYNQSQEESNVNIYDIQGRKIAQKSIPANGNWSLSLKPQQPYILKMTSSLSNESKKIMIQ